MKSTVLAFALCGCLTNNDIAVDDVVVTVGAPSELSYVADGHSPIPVEVCTNFGPGLDPKLTASLKTSIGTWVSPDADPKSTTVPMSLGCEVRDLTPTNDPGQLLVVTATIGTFTKQSDPIKLVSAAISAIDLTRVGSIDAAKGSTITITANLETATSGLPSAGTAVTFAIEGTRSDSYFATPKMLVTNAASVQSSLVVQPGASTPIVIDVTAGGLTSSLSIAF